MSRIYSTRPDTRHLSAQDLGWTAFGGFSMDSEPDQSGAIHA